MGFVFRLVFQLKLRDSIWIDNNALESLVICYCHLVVYTRRVYLKFYIISFGLKIILYCTTSFYYCNALEHALNKP